MNRDDGFRTSNIATFVAVAAICCGQLFQNQEPSYAFSVFGFTLLYSGLLVTCIQSIPDVAPEKRLRQWILLIAFLIPMFAMVWFTMLFPAGMKPEIAIGIAALEFAFHRLLYGYIHNHKPIEGA